MPRAPSTTRRDAEPNKQGRLCYPSWRGRANSSQEYFEPSPKDGSLMPTVKPLRLQSLARLFTVVLLIVSWLAATNHCAFAAIKPTTTAAGAVHGCCHGCQVPAKQAPMDSSRECCRAIQGAPVPEKVGEKFESAQVAGELFVLLQVLVSPSADPALVHRVFDHGPPRVVSFAESVLQRSLFSHAPPLRGLNDALPAFAGVSAVVG